MYTVHSPQQPRYTMYASTSSAWHHITSNFMLVCPYTSFTHTSTTSHLFPEFALVTPSIPSYPTQHYVMHPTRTRAFTFPKRNIIILIYNKKYFLRHGHVIFASSFYSHEGNHVGICAPSDSSLLLGMKQRQQQNLI